MDGGGAGGAPHRASRADRRGTGARALAGRATRALRNLAGLAVGLITAGAWAAPPAAHALLIGIGDYAGVPHVTTLHGPPNDVALMKSVLRERFALPETHIEVLVDAQATHTRLREAFARLAGRIAPGDFVYIHYAGHGSYTPNPHDPTGVDQTWIPHGARQGRLAGDDDRDIRDKALSQWLRPIYAKTPRVVFVSDSCHSASVSRGPSPGRYAGVREAPPDPRPQPAPAAVELAGDTPGVKVGAAEDIAPALEFDPDTGQACQNPQRCWGVFTWHWAQSLMQARPGQTWQDVHARTYALVGARPGYTQRPQISGAAGSAVFGGATGGPASVAVIDVDAAAGTVRLGAGALMGVTVGSTYSRSAAEERAGAGEATAAPARGATPTTATTAALEIVAVTPFDSTARLTAGRLARGDTVREQHHAYDMPPIRLGIAASRPAGADGALVQRLGEGMKGLPGYALVGEAAGADLLLQVLRPRCTAQGCEPDPQRPGLPRSVPGQPAEIWLTTRLDAPVGGRHRWPLDDEAAAIASVRQRLDGFARAAALERLQSPAGAPQPVHVEALHLRPAPGCASSCLYLPRDRERRSPMRLLAVHALPTARIDARVGDALTFRLRNDDPVDDWHLYLLDIDRAAGQPEPVFPARSEHDGAARLESGKPARDLTAVTALRLTTPGVDVLKAIVSLQPLSMALLAGHDWRETARGQADPIARLLAPEAARRSADRPPPWSTFQTEVVVHAAAPPNLPEQ